MPEQATIEDLARAADDAGARLSDGFDDLAERLNPGRLIDDALDIVKTRGAALARDAGGVIKAHPVVAGAAVAAVGLALFAGNRLSKAELDLGDDLTGYTDYDDSIVQPAAALSGDLAESSGNIVSENPVLAILAGLAAGAALAMLFPSSDAERRSLGALARRVTSL
ncbi:hypothetical protein [Sandarakinorhabdus sp.]|uniref:hypothetical protein n=1 Tax=Sandarakinorhabdus sp. TaxID=1916663 RepID=UPI00333F5046